MKQIVLLLLLIIVATILSCCAHELPETKTELLQKPNWVKPDFCRDLDCPEFEVVKKTEHYTIRKYKPGVWVSVISRGKTVHGAVSKGFMKLFRYISGDNEQEVKIHMAAPVVVGYRRRRHRKGHKIDNDDDHHRRRRRHRRHHHHKIKLVVSFFLPYEYQGGDKAPPTPKQCSGIKVIKVPELTCAVYEFGGYIKGYHDVACKSRMLRRKLREDNIDHDCKWLSAAMYDSPAVFKNRHNEVMVKVNLK